MAHPGFRTRVEEAEGRGCGEGGGEGQLEGGGARLEQGVRAVRDAAWAGSKGAAKGCVGAGADAFSASWEREREVAVLLALSKEWRSSRQ